MSNNLECLLLHGWGAANSIWQDFAESLPVFNKVSSPCLYEAAKKSKDNKFDSIAASISDRLNVDTVVVAWSIGGLVAIPLAKLTNKVKAIVFIASSPCFVNKKAWQNVIESKNLSGLNLRLSENPTSTLVYFAGLIAHGDASMKETNKTIRNNLADEKHSEILSSWLIQMQDTDQRKELEELNIPIQFIFGENDSLVNSKIKNQIKKLNSNIEMTLIDNCGHAPFLSKQDKTSKAISRFINAKLS